MRDNVTTPHRIVLFVLEETDGMKATLALCADIRFPVAIAWTVPEAVADLLRKHYPCPAR